MAGRKEALFGWIHCRIADRFDSQSCFCVSGKQGYAKSQPIRGSYFRSRPFIALLFRPVSFKSLAQDEFSRHYWDGVVVFIDCLFYSYMDISIEMKMWEP